MFAFYVDRAMTRDITAPVSYHPSGCGQALADDGVSLAVDQAAKTQPHWPSPQRP